MAPIKPVKPIKVSGKAYYIKKVDGGWCPIQLNIIDGIVFEEVARRDPPVFKHDCFHKITEDLDNDTQL